MPLCLTGLRDLAIHYHAGQMYGPDKPYVYHLDAVHACTVSHSLSIEYQRAAYGHDLLEDTNATIEILESNFGYEETGLISSVTAVGENRRQRTASKILTLEIYPAGINLYLADRIANYHEAVNTKNLRKMLMYAQEYRNPGYEKLHQSGKQSMIQELHDIHMLASRALRESLMQF